MSGFKKVALLAVSTVAAVAMSASVAQAGTAVVTVDDGSGPSAPCNLTFNNSGTPPTSPITISNVVADSSCAVDIVNGGGTLTIGATASLAGSFVVDAGFWNCTYTGTLTGPAAATALSGTATTGGFLCPSPVTVSLSSITY